MNPFIHPTIAKPLDHACWEKPAPRSIISSPAVVHSKDEALPASSSVTKRASINPSPRAQSRVALILGAITLTGLLLAPAIVLAVDINTATAEQLQEIKGIGPKMARTIIEERQRGGRFESMTDVSERVKGVGPKKAAAFKAAGLAVRGNRTGAATTLASGKKGAAGTPARKR